MIDTPEKLIKAATRYYGTPRFKKWLAADSGISRSTIHKICNGEATLTRPYVLTLTKLLTSEAN